MNSDFSGTKCNFREGIALTFELWSFLWGGPLRVIIMMAHIEKASSQANWAPEPVLVCFRWLGSSTWIIGWSHYSQIILK